MKNKRILFMGTTDYAAHILEALIKADYQIIGIVSQPDRPFGRKKELKPTFTKEVGLKYNIPVYGFENINEHVEQIKALDLDLIITCAYGQKVSMDILNAPRYRSINVHGSLLPKYRGGAPIHYAIMKGEQKTGNTIMYMEETLDSGDMLASLELEIDIHDTVSSLYPRMMENGATLLLSILDDFFERKLQAIKQDDSLVTFAPNISKELEFVDYNRDVLEVYNHMRGLINWPGCYSYLTNKKIKFLEIFFENEIHDKVAGYVVVDNKEFFKIYTNNGYIKVYQFQLEGKKPVCFKDYLNGNKLELVDGVILNEGINQ